MCFPGDGKIGLPQRPTLFLQRTLKWPISTLRHSTSITECAIPKKNTNYLLLYCSTLVKSLLPHACESAHGIQANCQLLVWTCAACPHHPKIASLDNPIPDLYQQPLDSLLEPLYLPLLFSYLILPLYLSDVNRSGGQIALHFPITLIPSS